MSSTSSQIRIAFEDKFDLDKASGGLIMRKAIAQLHQEPAAQEVHSAPDEQYILQGTYLRDVLLRSFSLESASLHQPLQAPDEVAYVPRETLEHESRELRDHGGPFKDDMRIQSWARRYARQDSIKIDGDPPLDALNPTQIRAIATMLGERICLVQGVHFEVHHPILVCTYTNVAVDNLVEGFAAAGLKPLRVGFGAKVKSSLGEYTLDHQLEKHPLKPKVDKLAEEETSLEKRRAQLEKKIKDVQKEGRAGSSDRLERMTSALSMLERQSMSIRSKLFAMHQEMLRDVTSAADVVSLRT
ncbi:hypothetical protein EDC04DRAFT_2903551 [Pisolithus marmoratus]|nr:hypothetical protein EDC04DRAFT_2903551 [Pisolithus marmoratus]